MSSRPSLTQKSRNAAKPFWSIPCPWSSRSRPKSARSGSEASPLTCGEISRRRGKASSGSCWTSSSTAAPASGPRGGQIPVGGTFTSFYVLPSLPPAGISAKVQGLKPWRCSNVPLHSLPSAEDSRGRIDVEEVDNLDGHGSGPVRPARGLRRRPRGGGRERRKRGGEEG